MAVEIQEIGLDIDLSKGTFVNTVYKNDKLQLVEVGVDGNGFIVYEDTGYWESEEIVINDKIQAFKNVVRSGTFAGGAVYKSYTKTSDDGYVWTEYIETEQDGAINSLPAKYAKVKIAIYAEKVNSEFYFDRFDEADKYNNEFINSDKGVLELKKEYDYPMTISSQDDDGIVFKKKIQKTKFKKINSIRLLEGE